VDITTLALAKKFIASQDFLTKGNLTDEINNSVSAQIATIVADAPESFDTLKEIADWIGSGEEIENTTAADMLVDITTLKGSENVQGSVNYALKEAKNYTNNQIIDLGIGIKTANTLPAGGFLVKNTAYILGDLKESIEFYFPKIDNSYSIGDMVYISYTIPSKTIKVTIDENNLSETTLGLVGSLDATSSNAYHEIIGIVSGSKKWSCVSRVLDE
jgi:hypothetical protein